MINTTHTESKHLNEHSLSEIKEFMDFASTFVIKDQLQADLYETNKSLARANSLVQGMLGETIDINGISVVQLYRNGKLNEEYIRYNKIYHQLTNEYIRDHDGIINPNDMPTFGELNYYYRKLSWEHNVLTDDSVIVNLDIAKARTCRHLELIGYSKSMFSIETRSRIIELYNEQRNYFLRTMYNGALEYLDHYTNFCKFLLVFMTLIRFINDRMEVSFNVDRLDDYGLSNLLYSHGVYFLDDMPSNYKRKVIRNLNTLINNKGDDLVFSTILDIFGFKNIEIFRYFLYKKYPLDENGNLDIDGVDLEFIKIPFTEKNIEKSINEKEYRIVDYDNITEDDPRWVSSKEDILAKRFNILATKYYDIQASIAIEESSKELSMLYNVLSNIELKYPDNEEMSFFSNISHDKPISLFKAFVGLQSLLMKMNDIEPIILDRQSDYTTTGYSSAYGDTVNDQQEAYHFYSGDVTGLLSKTYRENIELSSLEYHSIEDFVDEQNFVAVMRMYESNNTIREKLEEIIYNTGDYHEYFELVNDYNLMFNNLVSRDVFIGAGDYVTYLEKSDSGSFSEIVRTAIDSGDKVHMKRLYLEILKLINIFINSDVVNLDHLNMEYILEFVQRLSSFYKSYTIELTHFSLVLLFDSKYNNTVKLLDTEDLTVHFCDSDVIELDDQNTAFNSLLSHDINIKLDCGLISLIQQIMVDMFDLKGDIGDIRIKDARAAFVSVTDTHERMTLPLELLLQVPLNDKLRIKQL